MNILKMSVSTVLFVMAIQGCTPHHHHTHPEPQLQRASFATESSAEHKPVKNGAGGHAVAEVTSAGRQEDSVAGMVDSAQLNSAGRSMLDQQRGMAGASMAGAIPDSSKYNGHGHDHPFGEKFWESAILKGLELLVYIKRPFR